MQVELRERTLGELIGLTFSLAAAHFAKLLTIALVLGLPSLLLLITQAKFLSGTKPADLGTALLGLVLYLALLLAMLVVGPLQQGASLLLISGSFTGKDYSLGESLRVGWRKLLPLLGYSVVTGIIIVIGAVLLIVPAFIFLTWYFVGSAALIVEDLPWRAAMERSKALSEGRRWPLFGFILIVIGIVYLTIFVAAAILDQFLPAGTANVVINWAIGVLVSLPAIVAPVVYYFQLRVVKEALDVQSLSSLVDAIAARAQAAPAA